MLVVPLIGALTGFGFAAFGIWVSGVVPSIDSFNYVISAVLTPLFLVAGTFFPIDGLPDWASTAALLNPLYHCVELVRHAVFGFSPLADLGARRARSSSSAWRCGCSPCGGCACGWCCRP